MWGTKNNKLITLTTPNFYRWYVYRGTSHALFYPHGLSTWLINPLNTINLPLKSSEYHDIPIIPTSHLIKFNVYHTMYIPKISPIPYRSEHDNPKGWSIMNFPIKSPNISIQYHKTKKSHNIRDSIPWNCPIKSPLPIDPNTVWDGAANP